MMRKVVPIDFANGDDLQQWQSYILSHPDTQYADLGQWRQVFTELYGIRSVNLACIEDDRILGVSSLYLVASPFFGRLLVSCPFFGSGGIYADDFEVEAELLDAVQNAAEENRADFIEFRLRRPLESPYQIDKHFMEFELFLDGDEQTIWEKSFASNVRQNIRKSRKFPLVFSTTRDPAEPYQLISRTIRDLGTPFHPRRFFDLMMEYLGDHVLFSQVHLDNKLVAAGVMVKYRDHLSTPFIGNLKQFRHTRANYAQYWGIVQYCLENGISCFDLGRSPRGSSHQKFKQKWGAVPIETHYGYQTLSKKRVYRTVLEISPLEQFISEIWKRLPLVFTRRAGHFAARYIP